MTPKAPRRLPWRDEEFQLNVGELLHRGWSDQSIADYLKINVKTLRVWTARLGLAVERRRYSAKAIALRLGRHPESVRLWIYRGLLRAPIINSSTQRRHRHVSEESLIEFLSNPHYWHLWEPSTITDPALREWTEELRQAQGLWLPPKVVAKRFHVSVRTVRGWTRQGLLPARKIGMEWRIDPASLVGFTPPSALPIRKQEKRWTDDERRLLIDWRGRGCTYEVIAGRLGRTNRSVRSYYRLMRLGQVPLPPGYTPQDCFDQATVASRRGVYATKVRLNDTERAQLYARWQAGDYRNIYDAGRAWGISHETARTIINAGLAAEGKPAPGKGRRANRAA